MMLRAERSPTPMLPVPWWSEISPLRFASVEMTGMGQLFCHLGREISPLRSAAVEMTGMGGLFYNLRPKGATITLSGEAAVAP